MPSHNSDRTGTPAVNLRPTRRTVPLLYRVLARRTAPLDTQRGCHSHLPQVETTSVQARSFGGSRRGSRVLGGSLTGERFRATSLLLCPSTTAAAAEVVPSQVPPEHADSTAQPRPTVLCARNRCGSPEPVHQPLQEVKKFWLTERLVRLRKPSEGNPHGRLYRAVNRQQNLLPRYYPTKV